VAILAAGSCHGVKAGGRPPQRVDRVNGGLPGPEIEGSEIEGLETEGLEIEGAGAESVET
jgi:hypothetical protein